MKKIFLLSFIINSLYANTYFVSVSGSGLMDGSSWTNAFPGTSLQIVINNAIAGDEVWVSCGTYYTTATLDRSIAFSMKNGVSIYGSFEGTETTIEDRSFSCGPCSVLSGAIGTGTVTDNSYQVIRNIGLDNSAIIDGFEITGGYDLRTPSLTEGLGGGILNLSGGPLNQCSPTIRNCVIKDNSAGFGGGIFNHGFSGGDASPLIINCVIHSNDAFDGGGGIDNFGLSGNASPIIYNTIIILNHAVNAAGGIYCWGGNGGNASPQIYNSTIVLNEVSFGNPNGRGGAIVADRSNSGGGAGGGSGTVNIRLVNSIINFNQAEETPQFHIYENATIEATYSCFDTVGQITPHVSSGSNIGNIYTNPLISNWLFTYGLDECWMTLDDGYQLSYSSPCRNAGDSSVYVETDLLFNPRISGSNIDMGAYEFQEFVSTESESVSKINIYPNPTSEFIILNINDELEIFIFNHLGKLIDIKKVIDDSPISVKELSSGVYFLYIPSVNVCKKFVKI